MKVENEMGVIVEFARQQDQSGFEIVSIRAEFPDAIIRKDGVEYRVEFEYRSSNFNAHGHDPRECDLVVCWINDTPDFVLQVFELSNPEWHKSNVLKPASLEIEIYYWKRTAKSAQRRIATLEMKVAEEEAKKAAISSKEKPPKAKGLEAVLGFVKDNPKAPLSVIGKQIGRSKSTAENYTKQLMDNGKLTRNGHGWEVLNNG